jgi:single-strand DNA-binding protein
VNGAHVALVGRVTRPGELRYASAGTAMLRVGVLIEDNKRRDGDPPDFANVTIWSERAEELADRLQKGVSLYVEGKVKAQARKGQDGEPRASLDVSAWKAEPLGQIGRQAPRRSQQDQPRRPNAMPEAVAIAAGRNTRQQLGLDDDLGGWPE